MNIPRREIVSGSAAFTVWGGATLAGGAIFGIPIAIAAIPIAVAVFVGVEVVLYLNGQPPAQSMLGAAEQLALSAGRDMEEFITESREKLVPILALAEQDSENGDILREICGAIEQNLVYLRDYPAQFESNRTSIRDIFLLLERILVRYRPVLANHSDSALASRMQFRVKPLQPLLQATRKVHENLVSDAAEGLDDFAEIGRLLLQERGLISTEQFPGQREVR
jgi:hypothetical protein